MLQGCLKELKTFVPVEANEEATECTFHKEMPTAAWTHAEPRIKENWKKATKPGL